MAASSMEDFRLDLDSLRADLQRIEAARGTREVDDLLARAHSGDGLTPLEMAALWVSPRLATEALYQLALHLRRERPVQLETFSPLYMTNTCDAECRMCGMRRDNQALRRETADLAEVENQLQVLSGRGMHAVSLLTGEYGPDRRPWALDYVNQALRVSQRMQFGHVLINVGSIDQNEFETLLAGVERHDDGSVVPKLTMCTFQETYSREHYAKFMGQDPNNPRADYDRRLSNFDRSFRAGMRVANPGILVGLNPDLCLEMTALASHARHLLRLGMEIYLSVPRLRQIAGSHNQRGADDEQFVRLVSLLTVGLPECKIVLTTREPTDIQRKLVPLVAVLSAGSAAVTPYTEDGARFPLEASQFEVIDQRPFEHILAEHLPERSPIVNFEPPA
jgi:2-iminoacetate synthase